ncbi:PIN domain-containing protein [Streptacidiphilus sp. PAMC 29251]
MIVLDHTAVAGLRRYPALLHFAVNAPDDDRDRVTVPLLCLTAALLGEGAQQGLADDLGGYSGVDFAPLDFAAFHHIEQLVRAGVAWQVAHAVHVVQAAGLQPHDRSSCVILSAEPKTYTGLGVTVVDLAGL